MGFSRQEYSSGLPCPTPGDLPDPGIEPMSFMSSALAGRFFTTSATWEARTHGKYIYFSSVQFNSVAQSYLTLCHPMDCSMPGLPVHYNSESSLKLMSIESVMPSNHLILCHPLLLPPSILPSIRVFSNEVMMANYFQGKREMLVSAPSPVYLLCLYLW